MMILTKRFGSHFDVFQVEVRSNQVKLGQTLKLVFSNKIGDCLIQCLTVNSMVLFLFFVDGLELPKTAIQNFDMYGFCGFLGNLVTKN